MPHPDAISPELTRATDTLVLLAMEAVEAAGADFTGMTSPRHALVMPGKHLREVNKALSEWNLVSCAQGSCDSWTHPTAQASQQVFQAVDRLFEQARRMADISDDARIPFMASGHQLHELSDCAQQWAQAPRPRARCALR